MEFIEISINDISDEAAEAVSEVFNRYGQGGAVIETMPPDFSLNTVRTVIAVEDDQLLQKIEISLSLMGKVLPGGLPAPRLRFVTSDEWVSGWKEHFHVVHIGERVVIQPSWRSYEAKPGEIVIHLDPGAAFGSGLHPTTQLCLQILQQFSPLGVEQLPLSGVDLFDVGTGSGILSIAAAKLGAGPIRAVDTDAVAVRVAQENFERNGLSGISTAVGSAAAAGERRWSLVVANILSNVLIELMGDLKEALQVDGRLILSGIINEQEPAMLEALAAHKLNIVSRYVEGDWIALVAAFEPAAGVGFALA